VIFKTVNHKVEKPSYNINIANIDMAGGHWNSEKYICDFFDAIENFLYEPESLDRNLILHSLKLLKDNKRIDDMKFYRLPAENKLILLVSTDTLKFKEVPVFEREMSISFKRDKFIFSIVELIGDDCKLLKDKEKSIPISWEFDEKLTGKLNKLKHIQF